MSAISDRKSTRTIKVDYLARVEGEGALYVKIKGGAVADVQLRIFEPPRFFEAFLRGRRYTEAPDVTARICGLSPGHYTRLGAAIRLLKHLPVASGIGRPSPAARPRHRADGRIGRAACLALAMCRDIRDNCALRCSRLLPRLSL